MPMRNPLAGLVRRNPEAPSLRQRAASLKAAAARVIRKPVAAPAPAPVEVAETAPDPIFAAMAESRALQAARDALYCGHLPDAAPEWVPYLEAYEAWDEHVVGVLTQTVPTTAAGCVALAQFAVEFHAEEGVSLAAGTGCHDENLQVLRLIAQSPALRPPRVSLNPSSDTELLALGQRFEEAHAAWMALVPAGREADECIEAFRLKAIAAGMDGRSALMAAWLQEKPKGNHDREAAAFSAVGALTEAIITLPAHTVAGLAVKARAAVVAIWPTGLFEQDRALGEDENWDKSVVRDLIDTCVRLAKGPQSEDAEAIALVDAIEREWAAWTAAGTALRPYVGPDADARVEAINEPRYALIAAAEALPATSRAARHAKALAYAWWDAVEYEAPGRSREDCDRGGRLVLDIGAALNTSRVA